MRLRFVLSLSVAMILLGLSACAAHPAMEHHPDFPNVDTTGMTEQQKAVVLTAESFVLRGNRGQYDDTRLIDTRALACYRWSTAQLQPEDYTSKFTGYSNCAAFVHDLYLSALDLDIGYYTTASLTSGCKKVLAKAPISGGFASLPQAQQEELKQEFLNALQPGDLIVYRYADNANGHAMCYVGNNMMIHCTGSSYSYADQEEKYEDAGCFRYESIDGFWEEGNRRYLFDKGSYVIIRPLDDFNGEIPSATLDRMDALRGVVAEKTASHRNTQTVTPGQEVTFTFTLENFTGESKTLTVTDTVPKNTNYVSGAQEKNGDALSWKVKVPARQTVTVSYTVQVGESADVVVSSSMVERVPVNCPAITVGRTLTPQEQKSLADAAAKADTATYSGMDLADAIYKEALSTDVLSETTASEVLEGVFRYFSENMESGVVTDDGKWPQQWRSLDENGAYFNLVVPSLYGGRSVLEGTSEKPIASLQFMAVARTKMVTEEQLIPGDIIVVNDETNGFQATAYLYTDGKLLDLQTGEMIPVEPTLSQVLCRLQFVVIRPSLGM